MAEDEWARTTLTVWQGSREEHMALPGITLSEQLAGAEALLTQLAEEPGDPVLDKRSVRLFSSWTPKHGQHGMTLPNGLIRALGAVDGPFWMDVYPPEPTAHHIEG